MRQSFNLILLSAGLVAGSIFVHAAAQAEEAHLFHVAKYDQVITKDGRRIQGRILSKKEDPFVEIRDARRGVAVRLDKASQVKDVSYQATPADELKRLWTKHGSDPEMLERVAREAVTRFRGLEEDTLVKLESAASKNHRGLLTLLGERYMVHDMPDKAGDIAQKLIRLGGNVEGHRLLAQSYSARGKTKEALSELEKALKINPDDPAALLSLADMHLSLGDPEKAKQIFTERLDRNPNDIAALQGQGRVLLRQGQTAEAENSFQRALDKDANLLPAKLGKAACKLLQKEWDEAYRLAEDVLRYDNRNAKAYGIQGYARLMSGEIDQIDTALEKINYSLEEDSTDARVKVLKAVALHRKAAILKAQGSATESAKPIQDAQLIMESVEAANPDDAWLQYLLAYMHTELEEYAEAAKGYKRATQLAPAFAPAWQALGSSYLRLRKWEDAQAAYNKALELDDRVAAYHGGLGLALLGMNRLQAAQTALKRSRELDETNVEALCGLGYIANFEANEVGATEFFQQALAADGNCDFAAAALKKIFAQRDIELEYLTFAGPEMPGGWGSKGGRTVKAEVSGGKVRWRGNQGQSSSTMLEYHTQLQASQFVRLEADLYIAPSATSEVGLRISSGVGSAVSFFFDFGKDDQGQVAYRFRDYSGQAPSWRTVGEAWPADGRVRLGIETNELRGGVLNIFLNGKNKGSVRLDLRVPRTIRTGVFAQVPSKEKVDAWADNIALLKHAAEEEETDGRTGVLRPPEEQ